EAHPSSIQRRSLHSVTLGVGTQTPSLDLPEQGQGKPKLETPLSLHESFVFTYNGFP
ncbi:Hypothetical predicted protein, partial [Marmota monax]